MVVKTKKKFENRSNTYGGLCILNLFLQGMTVAGMQKKRKKNTKDNGSVSRDTWQILVDIISIIPNGS